MHRCVDSHTRCACVRAQLVARPFSWPVAQRTRSHIDSRHTVRPAGFFLSCDRRSQRNLTYIPERAIAIDKHHHLSLRAYLRCSRLILCRGIR
jgi:hypothetical protein